MIEYFPAPLRGGHLIGVGYSLRTGANGLSARLPALGAQIQVVVQGRARHERRSGPVPVPRAALIGPTSRAFDVEVAPGSWVVGCGLLPLGWAPVAGMSAHEALDEVIDLAALQPERRVQQLLDRVQGEEAPAEAVAALVRGVLERLPPVDPLLSRRTGVVERWLAGPQSSSLDALAAQLGLCHRQTSRLTQQQFGCSPKLLQMKYRALRVSTAMALGRPLTATTAVWAERAHYFDQSHLTHDFRRFVGVTPQRYVIDDGALVKQLVRSRLAAGARGPTKLWS